MTKARTREQLASLLDSNPYHRRLLYLFTWLAGLLALQIMHLALANNLLNLGLSSAFTAGFVYSYFLEQRWRNLTTYAVSLLAFVISIYYFMQVYGDLLQLGTNLGILAGVLIVLLAFKAFTVNDHRFILMFSVVFLLYSSVASYDLKFMLLLPVFLACAGSALYIANQIEIAVRVAEAAGDDAVPKTIPRFKVGRSFAWMLLRAVIGVILLSVVAYLLTPQGAVESRSQFLKRAPEVDQPEESFQTIQLEQQERDLNQDATIGLSDEFDLTDSRKLTAQPTPVLKVRSHRNGYLRAKVWDIYSGSGWLEGDPKNLDIALGGTSYGIGGDAGPEIFEVPLVDFPSEQIAADLQQSGHRVSVIPGNVYSYQDVVPSYELVRQEITLLDNQPPIYFTYYQPCKLENISLDHNGQPINQPLLTEDSLLKGSEQDSYHPQDFTYTVFSVALKPKRSELLEVRARAPQVIHERYTTLPLEEDDLAAFCATWDVEPEDCRPITRSFRNFVEVEIGQRVERYRDENGLVPTYAIVEAIEDYLSVDNGFSYTRQYVATDTERELTEVFCLAADGQQGYCRQFASAMAVMCRINGVPARVVTGYAPGNFSLIDNAFEVLASNAHAWVEVYIDGYGWIIVDPTPGGTGTAGKDHFAWMGELVDFLQELFVLDPSSIQSDFIEMLISAYEWGIANPIHSVTALALALLLVLLWRNWRRWLGRRRPQRFVPQNTVIAAFVTAVGMLERAGVAVRGRDTARAVLAQVVIDQPELAELFRPLVPVYERAAFSPAELRPEDVELARSIPASLKRAVEELRRSK